LILRAAPLGHVLEREHDELTLRAAVRDAQHGEHQYPPTNAREHVLDLDARRPLVPGHRLDQQCAQAGSIPGPAPEVEDAALTRRDPRQAEEMVEGGIRGADAQILVED